MRMHAVMLAFTVISPVVAQDLKPTEGYLPQFSRVVPRVTRAEIPLNVQFPEGLELGRCAVTFGVPFPRGALASADNVRMLEDGVEVPASIRRTATWERPDGDVKWILVDAQVRPGQRYALECGTEVRQPKVEGGVRVEDQGAQVTVTTGPLKFVMRRDSADLIHAAWLDHNGDQTFSDNETVIAPGSARPPYMTDSHGAVYPVSAEDDYSVVVEQPGPLHAVIKIEGWFCSAEGTRLCQHIARLHAYAGHSFVRMEHTFVVGFDTDKVQLRDIAIPVPLALGENAKTTFGLENGATREVAGPAYLVQDAADHFSLQAGDANLLAEGRKAAGWLDCSDGGVGVTVGVRHLWQEHPRELEFTGKVIVAHLWPKHHDRPLDFDAKAVLGPELYEAWDQVYWQNWYKGGLDQYDQAFGLAKSNELLLAFHGEDVGAARALCRALDEPIIVAATPEWMCRSDVMELIHPYDPKRFPDEERKMAAGFDRFEFLRRNMGNYGLINYGDVNYQVSPDEANKTWRPSPWRRFASRFYGHPVMPWVQFLRTGDRRHLHWGMDNARHVMDIDMAHLTNDQFRYPKRRGGRFGGNGGILHYAGNIYDIGCDSHVDQFLLYYYLTGYRRAWDVLQEEAEFYLWKDTQPGGALHRWAHRMTGGTMRTMIALYRATWDERYLEIARRMADFCYENQDEEGVIRHDDVYMLPGMFTYYQTTGDERMKQLILRCMKRQAKVGRNESDPRSFGFCGLSTAYFLTGDPSYLGWAERWKRDFLDCVTESDDPLWHGYPKGQWDYCYLTLHLLYMPYYLEALATLEEPVRPATRDDAVTSGEIVLWREESKPFSAVARWFCYDSSYTIGVTVNCLDRYLARNPTRARVVLRGPGGTEVATAPVAIAQGQKSGKVLIEAPAGPPGSYRLGIEDPGGLHFKLRLASTDLTKWAYTTEREYVACADAYYFYVPPDADSFELSFKTLALRQWVKFAAYDPAGDLRKEEEISYKSTPQREYHTWTFQTTAAQRGKLWRFTVTPSSPKVEQTYLKFKGVPPVVWTNPEAFFIPDEDAISPRPRPEPVVRPYADAGSALRIEPDKPFTIPRGEATGEGRYQDMNPQQGTLEFWLRPEWELDDISDHTIARCGKANLYRRSRIGTYFTLGGIRQSGLITEPGRWYHLAVTWDAGAPGRAPQTQLFINGISTTGTMLSPAKEPLGDWTGETLTIGGDVAFTVDDLRVSDIVRYDGDFDVPESPQADEHTLLLERF